LPAISKVAAGGTARAAMDRDARVAALLTMRAERIRLFVQRRQSHRGTHSRATESHLSRLRSGYL
jgi:hypothetical protein